MEFYFLAHDFEKLNKQISGISDKIREIGHEMGISCQEGAETYHDNFAYEDGERQQFMWSSRLKELIKVKNYARVVTPGTLPTRVALGSSVAFVDLDSGEEKVFSIGSYMTFDQDSVSYAAPLGKILVGAVPGEERSGLIAGKRRRFEVLEIHSNSTLSHCKCT